MDELSKRQKIISQLVEARLEQGISQAELARRLGIQRSGINRLESGTQNPTLDMILKIASALGKDVSLELNDKEEPMSHVYSLRIYDTELMRFSMEKQGLSGLVAEILYTNEEQAHLLPVGGRHTSAWYPLNAALTVYHSGQVLSTVFPGMWRSFSRKHAGSHTIQF